ncbi:MAG: nucleoside triphosphate pyrophosphatase [Pseudomonadota bacterium]
MLILASQSAARQSLLRNAEIPFETRPARVDEEMVTESLLSEGHTPRAVADALAEMKALRINGPGLILGCDQTLDLDGMLLGKPEDPDAARKMLRAMSGRSHRLHSAAVIAEDGKPAWRNVADVSMAMRSLSEAYIDDYVSRNWSDIQHCAGAYMIEAEGARLFHQIRGDHFAVLGLPLLPLIDFLITRNILPS